MKAVGVYILLFLLSLFVLNPALAQLTNLKGQITEPPFNTPLPFVQITINDGERHCYSDIEGNFDINYEKPITKLTFSYHLYRDQVYYPTADDTIPLKIEIHQSEFYAFDMNSTPEGEELFKKVMSYKELNNPKHLRSYEYYTYNKLTLS